MKEIVKGSFLKSLIPLFAAALIIFPANVEAGVLESLDNELTSLVALAEPFLVTVECRFNSNDNVYVGSGFLIDDEGYIISTTTVVGEAEAAKIIFKDGASYDAQIVGKDYHTGLALLQIEPVNRQIPVIGDSYDIREGSWVFVIGNSFEIPNAVNLGVYSGLTDEGFLQLSVQTGPGGSGSAVFNTKGELIGILVAQASETVSLNLPSRSDSAWISKARGPEGKTSPKTSETLGIDLPSSGISLALPAAKLESIVNQLKETGEAKHGFFGIRQKALSAAKKEEFGLTCGVEIVEVVKGTAADQAGIRVGDIINKFDGQIVKNPGHLFSQVRSHSPDEKVIVEVIRGGAKKNIEVVLGEAPNDGYFGFMQNPRNTQSEQAGDAGSLGSHLSQNKLPSRERMAEMTDKELSAYIAVLENRISKLETRLNELQQEIDNNRPKKDE